MTPLLEISGASKRFGAVEALRDVDLTVNRGEVVALAGDNGAGKSTLIKAISGVQPADEAEIRFDGESVHIRGPHDAPALGIAVVYQDLALCDNLDVVANLFLGSETREGGLRFMDEIVDGGAGDVAAALVERAAAQRAGRGRHALAAVSASRWRSRGRCWASRRW